MTWIKPAVEPASPRNPGQAPEAAHSVRQTPVVGTNVNNWSRAVKSASGAFRGTTTRTGNTGRRANSGAGERSRRRHGTAKALEPLRRIHGTAPERRPACRKTGRPAPTCTFTRLPQPPHGFRGINVRPRIAPLAREGPQP